MGIRAWIRKRRIKPPKDRKITAIDIAEYFIARSHMENGNRLRLDGLVYWDEHGKHESATLPFDIDSLKIHYLIYYAEAWSLGLLGESLFSEEIRLVSGRPDISSAYYEYHHRGFERIPIKKTCEERLFTSMQLKLLDTVWEFYGRQNRHYLSGYFHQELPFKQAERQGKHIISRDTMSTYYKWVAKSMKKAE